MHIRKALYSLLRQGAAVHLPRIITKPARSVCENLGLFDQRQYKLGLTNIRPSDIFLASYPKSGNTWLRFIIANILSKGGEVSFRNIDEYVPTPEFVSRDLNLLDDPRIIKSHWPYFDLFPRFIYIVRDPRDVVVSYYHYCVKHKWFEGTISEFAQKTHGYGDWGEHVRAALNETQRRPEEILFLKYEDMLANSGGGIAAIGRFLGLRLSDETIAEINYVTSFHELQKNEQRHGGHLCEDDYGFFRSGKVGQWTSQLTPATVEYVNNKYVDLMRILEYVS